MRVLMYHDVGDSQSNPGPFCVSSSDFREQMRVLSNECNVVSIEEGLEGLANGNSLPPRSVAITFDDGRRGVLDNAAPVLDEFELPAALFVRCDVLENGREPGGAEGSPVYLTWQDADVLLRRGWAIGAHTVSHVSLARIPEEKARWEIQESKRRIERRLGISVRLFAYPYGTGGDVNEAVVREVRAAGFSAAFTAINGPNSGNDDLCALRRTKVEGGDSLKTFRRLLAGGMDAWALVDRFGWRCQSKRRLDAEASPERDGYGRSGG